MPPQNGDVTHGGESAPDAFGLIGRTLAGKFAVERVVASGGFGTVYYARHLELQTGVAVKVLRVPERYQGALRSEFIVGFKREARTTAALAHAAVVRVLDYGSEPFASGEAPWMALEWLEGRTLEAEMKSGGTVGGRRPLEALELLRPAFEALACAHAAGVAHRDIKPANLMLVKARRGEPGLRVLDFGIAKAMEPDEHAGSGHTATKSGHSSYSLFYAAPEQVTRGRTGPWTDVHALALVLVELLTGRRANGDAGEVETYARVLDRERPTPGRFEVDVGPWEAVLARALALRPLDRYPNAEDFLTALEALGEPADRAWRSRLLRGSLDPSTEALAETAVGPPRSRTPPRPAATVTDVSQPARVEAVSAPSPASRRILPAAAALLLALVALWVHAATRPRVPDATARPSQATPPAAPQAGPEPARPAPSAVAIAQPPPAAPTPTDDRANERRARVARPRAEPVAPTQARPPAPVPTPTPAPRPRGPSFAIE